MVVDNLERELTALADNEIRDKDYRAEIITMISNDRKLKFLYDVQVITSKILKEKLVKYPVPYQLNQKLLEVLYKRGKK